MQIDNIRKLYFVGIGGIAMSAAAGIAKENNFEVEGSDSKEIYSPAKDVLDRLGVTYFTGYSEENVKNSYADAYILSAGEDENNPEVKYILDNNLPYYSFSELLYNLAKDRLRIVVTGTHGKSTTSAILGFLLKNIDDSSFVAGAVLRNLQSNFHYGSGHYFVFEGDEYKTLFDDPSPKFHLYKPDIVVLTNLEFDHPDLFASVEDTKQELSQLLSDLPEDGLVVYNADNAHLSSLVYQSEVANFSFGIHNPADFKVENISFAGLITEFDVIFRGDTENPERYRISQPGEMNIYNALGCIATLRGLGFSKELIYPILEEYQGLKRRFEVVAEKAGITIIDDYAHHATAVKETLVAAKAAFPGRRVWAIFEPHTFSRTEALLQEFSECFDAADKLIVADIYPAREKVRPGSITTQKLIEEIQKHKPEFVSNESVWRAENKEAALKTLKDHLKSGDVVIVMAVGNFNRLAYDLAENL